MGRFRFFAVALIAGVFLLGVPMYVSEQPHAPSVVSRDVSLAPGTSLEPTATRGAIIQRRAPELGMQGNLVAVSFNTNAVEHEALERDVTIEARFRTAAGWGSWEQLAIEPDEGPDGGSEEAARGSLRTWAGPIWVGTADRVDVRMRSEAGGPDASDIRVHVINSKGDAQKPTYFHRAVGAISRVLRGATPAYAYTGRPRIITRSQWGANERWRSCCLRYAPTVHMAFVHHTVGSNRYSSSDSAAIVRSIYRYHTSNRGWSDIGYNFLIDRYGQTFEGRFGGIEAAVRGAHTAGFNLGSTGISLMGTFTSTAPTSRMLYALRRLLAWKLDVHHVPAIGSVRMTSSGSPLYPEGTWRRFRRISGHRDGQATACPGTEVYRRLPAIRTAVDATGQPKIYLPRVYPSSISPNGDGVRDVATISATFSRNLAWALTIQSATGETLRTFSGRGYGFSVVWDGRTLTGLVPNGQVRYTITGRTSDGLSARIATGTFVVVNPPPPTPTPTPSPTETGTSEPEAGTTGTTDASPTGTPEADSTGTPSPTASP